MIVSDFDDIFRLKTESWVPIQSEFHRFFSDSEIDTLSRSSASFNINSRTVVFLSFENSYASLGGLGTISRYLPRFISGEGERVVFLSPYYKNNPAFRQACDEGRFIRNHLGDVGTATGMPGRISLLKEKESVVPAFYIDADGFFDAEHDPYDYGDPIKLLYDSMAFCRAVPYALRKMGVAKNIILHANDWETALTALSSKIAIVDGVLDNVKTVLTLHNSFDSSVTDELFVRFFRRRPPYKTVLQNAISLLDGPLTTVSTAYAYEMRHDPFQKDFFTPHLQRTFSMNPPVGVENGLFGKVRSPFSKTIMRDAGNGNYKPILAKKRKWRDNLERVLKNSRDSRSIGRLTFSSKNRNVPIFFMSGRYDLSQKGFDLIFWAFRKLKRGSAKLFFSPSNPKGGSKDLEFFREHAEDRMGDIIILPYLLPGRLYRKFLRGSSYLVMPSFYEPFGAATEGFLHGTPVIARGTGGLWMQVETILKCDVPKTYQMLFINRKARAAAPTGILFREESGGDAASEWREILSKRPDERISSPLYRSMVDAAYKAMAGAVRIFKNSDIYGGLIANGTKTLSRFEWDRSVKKYLRIYDIASSSGYF